MNDPVTTLEQAVEGLRVLASRQPGEVEEHLPRIRAAEYALLGLRADVTEACGQARREALHRATQSRVAKHLESIT